MSHQLGVRPWLGGELPITIQQTNEQIGEIRARREAISKHACREFSIERSAKAFLDAIRGVMREK